MDRSFEYTKMQYEWIIKCLTEDDKWEELAFFELGVDLGIRIAELKNIKWEQIDFPLVKDVKISKSKSKEEYYKPLEISLNAFEAINRIYDKRVDGYIFQYNPYHYIRGISESIGTIFNGNNMRSISLVFKANQIQKIEK